LELARRGLSLGVPALSADPNFQAFTMAEITSKVDEDVYYLFGWYTEWIERKVVSLRALIRGVRDQAPSAVKGEFERLVQVCTAACRRQHEALLDEAKELEIEDDSRSVAGLKKRLDAYRRCLDEYNAALPVEE
jgi:hypothetical protein